LRSGAFINKQQRGKKQQKQFFEQFKSKPFWIWDREEHKLAFAKTNGQCCFNHIIGLPKKNGQPKPLFDYEREIFDVLSNHKHVWIKKATGLGITEFMLRYMAWLCVRDDALRGTQMTIITGPRIDLAIGLIDRIKGLFSILPPGLSLETKETVAELNGCKIEAFPSHHVDSMRGLPNVSFILLDEADFFPSSQQKDARVVSERYIAKSNPWIVMVSTPNAPEGLFDQIEKEPEDKCLYSRIFLPYTVGLGKIYTLEEIERAKRSPSFPREYDLQYLGQEGNVFHHTIIQRAMEAGKTYDPDEIVPSARKALGIDPAFGSSKFAFVLTQLANGRIEVLYADEFERPDFAAMISHALKLMTHFSAHKIYVDASNPAIIMTLKRAFRERTDYQTQIAQLQERRVSDISHWMNVIPVAFRPEHREMLGHAKLMMDHGIVAIHPRFSKLITSLRTAVAIEGTFDKASTAYNDIFDAFRLSLQYYKLIGLSGYVGR
jgi:hypothetical protein